MSTATTERTGAQSITFANLQASRMSDRVKETRETSIVHDEFRREYTVTIDTNVRRTVGIVSLYPAQPAPVDIPVRYCRIDPRKKWRLLIDWDAYIRDLQQAKEEWEQRVDAIMRDLFKDTGTAVPDTPTPRALKLAGDPPQDWRVVALAKLGDPWALGFRAERTAAIRRVLGDQPFLPAQRAATARTASYDAEMDALLTAGDEVVRASFEDERDQAPRRRTAAPTVAAVAAPALDDEEGSLGALEEDDEDEALVLTGDDDVSDDELTQTPAASRGRRGARSGGS